MTTFTLAAEYHGRQAEVTWTDGMLSGDSAAVDAVASRAMAEEGKPVATPSGTTWNDHLVDAHSAYLIIHIVLGDNAQLVAGEVPEISA